MASDLVSFDGEARCLPDDDCSPAHAGDLGRSSDVMVRTTSETQDRS